MKRLKIFLLSITLLLVSQYNYCQTFSTETILITTAFGNIKLKLFNETPLHKANFIRLVNNQFYDSLLFHRIIQDFMIQGGDPDSKHCDAFKLLGDGDLSYTIPAEFVPSLCHKKGMVCAARNNDDVNPTKASSAAQFYIVQGKVRNDVELDNYEKRINATIIKKIKENYLNLEGNKQLKQNIFYFKTNHISDSLLYYTNILDQNIKPIYDSTPHYQFNTEHKKIYKTIGGTPHLDSNYTIFGEIISGLEVIDKIAAVAVNKDDRPLIDLRMTIKIINE